MNSPHSPRQNHLLASLPEADLKRLLPHLERVPMPLGESYCESGGELQYVYFPTTAIVSLLYVMESGAPAEIAEVGNEGMLGISKLMEGNSKPSLAYVRMAGHGYRMKMQLLMEEFDRSGSMQRLLLRYAHALITQTSRTAVCNLHLSVDQRLCRWLLLTFERIQVDELILIQKLLAKLFGVGCVDVMGAVEKLQQSGLVRYHQGHITVLDRRSQEDQAYEGYGVIKKEFDRLLGLDWDWRPMSESVKMWPRASANIFAQR